MFADNVTGNPLSNSSVDISTERIAEAAVTSVIAIITLIGNISLSLVILMNSTLRVPANMFIL